MRARRSACDAGTAGCGTISAGVFSLLDRRALARAHRGRCFTTTPPLAPLCRRIACDRRGPLRRDRARHRGTSRASGLPRRRVCTTQDADEGEEEEDASSGRRPGSGRRLRRDAQAAGGRQVVFAITAEGNWWQRLGSLDAGIDQKMRRGRSGCRRSGAGGGRSRPRTCWPRLARNADLATKFSPVGTVSWSARSPRRCGAGRRVHDRSGGAGARVRGAVILEAAWSMTRARMRFVCSRTGAVQGGFLDDQAFQEAARPIYEATGRRGADRPRVRVGRRSGALRG